MTVKFVPASYDDFCENPVCPKKIKKAVTETNRVADKTFIIIDHPVLNLCKECSKEWAKMWVEFGGQEPEVFKGRRHPIRKAA